MHFQRLEDLRIDNDKTQAEVAKHLGCQREVYRRYEKGTRQIPIDYLIEILYLIFDYPHKHYTFKYFEV